VTKHPYTEWFLGSHDGVAPAAPPAPRHAGETIHLNGMDSVVREIARMRESVLSNLEISVITRDDQFGVLLQLADDMADAIDELTRIGWPARHPDGRVTWEAAEPPFADAEEQAMAYLTGKTFPRWRAARQEAMFR